jgi:putative membrane protein insertion efficiency factor
MTLAQRLLTSMIRLYQAARLGKPSPCRFQPSCSEYAAEAVQVHGAFRGTWYALRRVARCNPFGRRGFDPVPAK